jgi:hypothetical protein
MLIKKMKWLGNLGLVAFWVMSVVSLHAEPGSSLNKEMNTTTQTSTTTENKSVAVPIADSVAPPDRGDVFAQGLKELELAEARIHRHPDSVGPHLDRLRILFVLGVKKEQYLQLGSEEIEILKRIIGPDPKKQNLILGYTGAIQTVQAKHGFNLKRKWKNLETGLPILDTAVARDPKQSELRYLRLVNNYYLPFFLGRKSLVKEDFAALARLLPNADGQFPPKWYLNVAGFVVENGKLTPEQRTPLVQKMQQVKDAARAQGLLARDEK